jgi:hypothetical protein
MPATLALSDLFPPDDFLDLPEDDADRRHLYLVRCRRVRVGPSVSVVFENRQTLWFRVQELSRLARATDPGSVQAELDWYASLLPGRGKLTAAVWVSEIGRRPTRELDAVRRAVVRGRIGFRTDDGREVAGVFRTDRVNHRLTGLARWAEFHFTEADVAALADRNRSWRIFVESDCYRHESEPIHEAVRASLLDDLA